MGDTKIFAENEKELENLIQTIRINNLDKGMEFSSEQYNLLKTRSITTETTEETELPNQKRIKKITITWKYCKWKHSNKDLKNSISEEQKKILESKGINT